MKFVNILKALRKDDNGVTLVEYGIAISLAIVLGTGALFTLAGNIGDTMNTAGGQMCTTAPAAGATSC